MPQYVFLPVPTKEMKSMADQLVETCRPTAPLIVVRNFFDSGAGKGMLRHLGLGCLKGVTAASTLYVLLHGRGEANSSLIGAARGAKKKYERGLPVWKGGVFKTYTMDRIADVLQGEGLPTDFVHLHLLTCGSGLRGNKGDATDAPLAERLHAIMHERGFVSLEVTGYTGDVLVNISRNNWFAIESGTKFLPAAEASITIT